ncbi:transcription initiation factor TFIID subunit 11 [Coemansia erecta]|nr:transcription initiation factor TFIID subunit 11 [Coemansia erecta]
MSDQSRNSGAGSNNNTNGGNGGGGGTPVAAKKRQRQTALTPAGILRQRKRRGGGTSSGTGTPSAGRGSTRTPSGSRSGTPTPTKLRTSMSQSSLVLPNAGSVAEKRGRRGSTLGLTSSASEYMSAHEPLDTAGSPTRQQRGKQRSMSGANQATGADHEDEDDEDDDDNVHASEANPDDNEFTLIRQSKEEVGELWDQMSEEQQQRYGVYRRTALNKGSMKKLVSGILNQQVSSTLTFVVAGFAKVFVGEIVERAIQIQHDRGEDDGPLTPEHLREAYRLHKKESQIPLSSGSGFTKRLF